MAKQKKSISEQIEDQCVEFRGEVDGLNVNQLNDRLATLAKYAEENEQAREDDEELEKAKETAKELGSPYREARKMLRLKSRYVCSLIKEKGND